MSASRPIRVAILECDTPVPPVLEKVGTYGDIFSALLTNAAVAVENDAKKEKEKEEEEEEEGRTEKVNLQFSAFNVVDEPDVYPQLEDVDAILITGSKHGSYKDIPWIIKLVEFTAEILKQDRIKLVGICFGHQIIGRALGVKVGPNEKGWEVAVTNFDLTDEGKKLFGLERMNLQFLHRDIVHEIPPSPSPLNSNATIECIGGNAICENQGMYSPGHFITFQGHPEFTGFIVSEIVKIRRAAGVFTDDMARDFLNRAGVDHDGLLATKSIIKFLQG
ncbi:hypothetical protein KEM54_000232 [Ascosphaera aggregata]|nr:hypothetical protein KEM54_000232 [Ascosphaera aggregata]